MLKRLIIAASLTATGAAAEDYPVVFGDKALLREVGVTIQDVGPGPDVPQFADKCFYYGDGGDAVTVSPELVAAYRAKGFSVGSLCLGILSGVRFDPATGARLATFVVADLEMMKDMAAEIEQYGVDPFMMSRELTLEVPACFAGGRPMTDCDWRHEPMTGKPLNEDGLRFVRELAAAADRVGREAVASGRYDRICGDGEWPDQGCRVDTYPDTPDNEYIKGRRGRELYGGEAPWPVSFFDISPEYPEGFGYALFADGAAGPSAEMGAEKIALDPKKRASMAIIEGLKIKLK